MFMFVDADNLKRINDRLGHNVGDVIIKHTASILQRIMPKNALICRKGGDEFLAVVPVNNEKHGLSIATKVHKELCGRHLICGHYLEISCSIGLALSNEGALDFQANEHRADIAMYFSKTHGKGQVKAYCPEDCKPLEVTHDLSIEFPDALHSEQLFCVFQPIYSMHDRRVVGCEALLRWHHDRHGDVSPEMIIEIAKTTGEMKNLSRAVLKMACHATASWPTEVYVSVNFAASDFLHDDCSQFTLKTLDEFQVLPSNLRIEITETELLDLNETVLSQINELRLAGVLIGMDDFGTGYASMGSIDEFPGDFIKIDRSLVARCDERESSKIFVRAIRQVAQKQSLEIIAEGVENLNEAAALRGCGIDFAQGYYLQRPTVNPSFSSWVPDVCAYGAK